MDSSFPAVEDGTIFKVPVVGYAVMGVTGFAAMGNAPTRGSAYAWIVALELEHPENGVTVDVGDDKIVGVIPAAPGTFAVRTNINGEDTLLAYEVPGDAPTDWDKIGREIRDQIAARKAAEAVRS